MDKQTKTRSAREIPYETETRKLARLLHKLRRSALRVKRAESSGLSAEKVLNLRRVAFSAYYAFVDEQRKTQCKNPQGLMRQLLSGVEVEQHA
jgi:hypothetical protein